ncbi:MAG: family 1 encapsulin nanocompartment shell protein [Gudongella sp.]|nr:family 1 encapsulin nanocompartment shell protein [Gudongella sp.]
MLYRELAPVSTNAWEEIDERAAEVLKMVLSARKVVKVNGPKGLDFNVISEGRLGETQEEGKVCYGNYNVLPLTETRIEFEIDRWELDNIERGAKDIELAPLEDALKELAMVEEKAVYNGLEKSNIEGLAQFGEEMNFGNNSKEIMEGILKGVLKLRGNYAVGAYTLVVGEEAYKRILSQEGGGYPLNKRLETLIEGKIVFSRAVKGAYLIPYDNDNLELTIGRDFSIGYQNHTAEKVRFFATESFTFRVLDSGLVVKFNL